MSKTTFKKVVLFTILGIVTIMMCFLCACQNGKTQGSKIEVTDIQGTKFTFDEPIKKVVSTHNPTLNHVIVLGNGTSKYLAGFGNKDKADGLYKKVLDDWDSLTVIGGNGNAVNKETVISLHPDLALVPENLAPMKDKDYEGTDVGTFVALPKKESFDSIPESSKLIAKLFAEDERANTVSDKFNQIINDAKTSVKNVKDAEKPKVLFMGTQKYKVATSDMIQTQILDAAGAVNVAADEFDSGFFASADAESIVKMNPQVIFFPGYAKITAEDLLNDEKLQSVDAIKNKKVYKFPCTLEPWDYPTFSACLGVAWATYTLHPDLYSKDKLLQTCDEFYKLLYNKTFTAQELGIQ